MKYEPINSEFGEFHGRDALYLDDRRATDSRLILKGEVNGELVSNSQGKEWIPYSFNFSGVDKVKETELDNWLSSNHPNFHETSSFYELIDPEAKGDKHRHFVIQTYDIVFEISCESYELSFNKNS